MLRNDLDAQLLEAHAAKDRPALIRLYQVAAAQANGEVAAGFYLTHAYVFALEHGDPFAEALHARLIAMGRDV
ncbi:MAG: hypothetical protein AAGA08_03020 [Pseudomonadota bacterium]